MILLRSGVVLLIIFLAPLAVRKVNRVASDLFRLTGWTGQPTIQAEARGAQAQGDRRLICQKTNGLGFPRPKVGRQETWGCAPDSRSSLAAKRGANLTIHIVFM
jgi:hypothetical protein